MCNLKAHLVSVKLINNRWAWELVPKRLMEPGSNQARGRRCPWQPWKRPTPKSPWHWMQSVEYLPKGEGVGKEKRLENKQAKWPFSQASKQANAMQTMRHPQQRAQRSPLSRNKSSLHGRRMKKSYKAQKKKWGVRGKETHDGKSSACYAGYDVRRPTGQHCLEVNLAWI